MEQLTLNIPNSSEIEIIASSAFNFRIELIKKIGNLLKYLIISSDVIIYTKKELS